MSPSDDRQFQYDVFISYSTNSNRHGWVTAFVEELQAGLKGQLPAERPPRIWWDVNRIEEDGPLTTQIGEAVSASRILLIILSPDYVNSKWCREERQIFLQQLPDPRVEKRVWLVDLGTVDLPDRPIEFNDLRGWHFYTETRPYGFGNRETLGSPKPNVDNPTHGPFFSRIAKLSTRLGRRLNPSKGTQSTQPTSQKRVYLAQAADDVEEVRDDVAEALAPHVTVVPPVGATPPTTPESWNAATEQWLAQADLFVQLVGSECGPFIPGTQIQPVPDQFHRAKARQVPLFIWRTPQVPGALDSALQPVRDAAAFCGTIPEFCHEIVKKVSASTTPRAEVTISAGNGKTAFVHARVEDLPLAEEVRTQLSSRGRTVWPPAVAGSPAEIRRQVAERVGLCDALVLVSGGETGLWLDETNRQLPRHLAERLHRRQDQLAILEVETSLRQSPASIPGVAEAQRTRVCESDPTARQRGIAAWIERVDQAQPTLIEGLPPVTSQPYPGLRAFEPEESGLFFGRDRQIEEILDHLKEHRFLAVVGSSGCGKSSLVKAGVIPALQGGALGDRGSDWRVVTFTPGQTPLANLAEALLQTGLLEGRWSHNAAGCGQLTATLGRNDQALVDVIQSLRLPPHTNLLVVVDQFEEVFRLGRQETAEMQKFVRLLLATKAHGATPIHLMLTMRSDFLGDCRRFEGLPEALNGGQYLCPKMERDEIRQAIERPAEVCGARVEDTLTIRLINDSESNSDQLPLVQHVLGRIWIAARDREQREQHDQRLAPQELRLVDYIAVGELAVEPVPQGAEGGNTTPRVSTTTLHDNALSRHCDEAYRELADSTAESRDLGPGHRPSPQQKLAQRLFCGLAELGNSGQYIRRPRTLQELAEFAGCLVDELRPVADVFRQAGRTFLRSPTKKPEQQLDAKDVLDVSHEALLRQWVRLAGLATGSDDRVGMEGWLGDEESHRREYLRLADAAERQAKAGWLRNPELDSLEKWWQQFLPHKAWCNAVVPHSYEKTNRFRLGSLAQSETEQQQREHEAQQELIRARNDAQRQKANVVFISLLCLVGFLTAGLAGRWYQQARQKEREAIQAANEATDERTKAEDQRKTALAQKQRAEQLVYANTLANAQRAWSDGKVELARQYVDAAQWNLRGWEHDYLYTQIYQSKTTFRGHNRPVSSVAYSPDGTRIVSGSYDDTLKVWDVATGQATQTLSGHKGPVLCVAVSPNGARIVSGSWDNTLKVWDAATAQVTLTLIGHTDRVNSVAYSPDGTRIVSGSEDKTLKVWDSATGQATLTLTGHEASVLGVEYSPDGTRIVSGSGDQTLNVWNAATGQAAQTLTGHKGPVRCVDFSPNGTRIVSGSSDHTLKVWDAATGQATLTLSGHTGPVESVAYSPDKTRIVSGSEDKTLKVWDAATGQATLTLTGHLQSVGSVAYSSDGTRIVSGSEDKTLKVWNAAIGHDALTLTGHTDEFTSVGFSPQGTRIVSGSGDNSLKVWDAATGQATLTLTGHTDFIRSVAYSPDGTRIVSGSEDKTLKVWDAATGKATLTLTGHTRGINSVAYSPDGTRIVSGSWDQTLKVWNTVTGQVTLTLTGHETPVFGVAYSPNGTRIVSGNGNGTLQVWDAVTGQARLTLTGHDAEVTSVAYSPDGTWIVSGSGDKTLKVWDASTGQSTHTLTGHEARVTSVAYSPDGTRIVSGSSDNTLKVWDAATGQATLTLTGHTDRVTSVAYSPDGTRVVSGSWDKTLKVWDGSSIQE
jgi:WD40 repeat protein